MSENIDPRLASFKSLTVKYSTLSRLSDPVFKPAQVQHLNSRTPANHIYERPGKGGGNWYYITSAYVIKSLNLLFGYRWSFDVKEFTQTGGQAIVLGQLKGTLTDPKTGKDFDIVKTDFGRADVKIKTNQGAKALDLGNDYKAAVSDCLKRCYRQLGGALDVYASNEYVEILVADEDTKESKKDKDLKKITAKAKQDLVKQRKEENDEKEPTA